MSETPDIRFRPLGKYEWPSTPVDHGLDRLRADILKRFRKASNPSGIDLARIDPAVPDLLDRVADAPACHPLMTELSATFDPWRADPAIAQTLQIVVLPPCDRENVLSRWSEAAGLTFFPADGLAPDLADLDDPDADPIVIPRLEDRFLRTPEGLIAIRGLIDQLGKMRRRTIVGCNSWAWQFLRKSCEIDLVLSDPMTFRAFNAPRLREWLGSLAFGRGEAATDESRLQFRSQSGGKDIFGNGDGEIELSSFMTDLAKRSLGIPWVAWHLWRASLYTERPNMEEADMSESGPEAPTDLDEVETIWVSELRSFALPNRSDQNALLILHALLIHGGLTEANIDRTVPLVSYTNALPSLSRAGLIDCSDGVYRCVPAAYPAIRDGLKNNGYPMDVL